MEWQTCCSCGLELVLSDLRELTTISDDGTSLLDTSLFTRIKSESCYKAWYDKRCLVAKDDVFRQQLVEQVLLMTQ